MLREPRPPNPKLTCEFANKLVQALSAPIDLSLIPDAERLVIEEHSERVSKKMALTDKRGRSQDVIFDRYFRGKLAEYSILKACNELGMSVEFNEEELTRNFNYDLIIDGRKIEVKLLQSADMEESQRKFISWSERAMIENVIENWMDFDYMIVGVQQQMVVYFWYLTDNQVWNPINSMLRKSKYKENGVFLRTSIVSDQLGIKIQELPIL